MRRITVTLAGLCVLCGLGLTTLKNVSADRIYSVGALRAGLAANPAALIGRTVTVRAAAVMGGQCPATASCVFAGPALVDPDAGMPSTWLPVTIGRPNGLLAWLRHVPLLGQLVPGPQQVEWGATHVYRVELRVASGRACGSTVCYEALIPDAVPLRYQLLRVLWRGITTVPAAPPVPVTPPAGAMPIAVP